jgi:hypothetical protein
MGGDLRRHKRHVANDSRYRSLGESVAEIFKNALAASHTGEPIVTQQDAAAGGRRYERGLRRANCLVHNGATRPG